MNPSDKFNQILELFELGSEMVFARLSIDIESISSSEKDLILSNELPNPSGLKLSSDFQEVDLSTFANISNE